MSLVFTKMHGLGNDFVVIEATSDTAVPDAARWRALADRHTGIGFDQALVIMPPRNSAAAAFYRIFNADGSEVEQCGNGARCVAEWLRLHGKAGPLALDSAGGRIEAIFAAPGLISVNMGVPRFVDSGESALDIDGQTHRFTQVSMGNPHAVIFVTDVDKAPVATLGPQLESHPFFPKRTNVAFLQIVDARRARLRVFERGVGETLACGTGACAAMATARRLGRLESQAEIALPGGTLQLRWDGGESALWMTGPAAVSFRGTIDN